MDIKNFFVTIKNNLILLFGAGLFTYSLFGIEHGIADGKDGGMHWSLKEVTTYPIAVYYYYRDLQQIFLAIGAVCIVLGIVLFIRDNGRESN